METGSTIQAAVIDVSKIEHLVDLSLKPEFVNGSKPQTANGKTQRKVRLYFLSLCTAWLLTLQENKKSTSMYHICNISNVLLHPRLLMLLVLFISPLDLCLFHFFLTIFHLTETQKGSTKRFRGE